MHVVEALKDVRQSTMVSNVLVDFDLTLEVICAMGHRLVW